MRLTFTVDPHAVGEPVVGPYFELFYLPLYGPSAVCIMRHLGRALADGNGVRYDVDERILAQIVGLPKTRNERRPASITTALDRLWRLELIEQGETAGHWVVRTHVPPLDAEHQRRLPVPLRARHDEVMAAMIGLT